MYYYAYIALLLVFAVIILVFSIIIGKRDKTELTKSIRYVMIAAPCNMLAYAGALLATDEFVAELIYAAYYTMTDILLLCMLYYTFRYTHIYKAPVIQNILMGLSVAVDGIIIFASIFTDKIFVFECGQVAQGGVKFFGIVQRGSFYHYHRFVVYSMVALILATLIIKIVKSASMYRKKYWLTLVSLAMIIAANIIYMVSSQNIDFSVIFYGIMAAAIYYFNGIYVPQGLAENFLSASMKSMDDNVLCFDADGKCVHANYTAYEFFKATSLETFDEFHRVWLSDRKISDIEDYSWKETRGEGENKRYYDIMFKKLNDKRGKYVGCFFKIHNQTDEIKQHEEERYRATHDSLTGIYNREYFYKVVTERVSQAEPGTYCMVCSNIKDFKLVNDIYGTSVGNDMLIEIANTMKKLAKPGTVYGRLSGDRFAMCTPIERFDPDLFVGEIKRMGHIEGISSYHVHIHLGVYNIMNKNLESSVMCDRAFMAIKTIKASMTDVIAYYDNTIRETTLKEQQVTGEFAAALESGQFCFYIQPQIASNGRTLGGEALVRWVHPDRGLVPPGEFIGVFERTGLICRLDTYVWEQACKKLREWKDKGFSDYHISVNISPKDFYFTDVYRVLTKLVERYDVEPRNLRLEITETAIINDFDKQLALIERLRSYGFRVEMDDFGSGYSSLNMLKDISVDTLKVDMGFLRQSDHEERSRTILRMVVSLSKQLGMEVVTEGVETKEQVDFLTKINCDVFQGYYFARPMPVTDFEMKYLAANA